MKWLRNVEQIALNNTAGVCPCCQSDDTEYSAKEVANGLGYAVIWCNHCRHAFNISRLRINKNTIVDKTIPSNLIF